MTPPTVHNQQPNRRLHPRWLALWLLAAISILTGCSTLTLDRVDPEKLTVNVEYRQMPDQVEVVTDMRAGFRSRRVNTGDTALVLEDQDGQRTPLEPTGRRGEYRLQANVGNGPYTLIVGELGELALPMGETLRLRDINQVAGQSVAMDQRLTFEFENPTSNALRWSYTGRCGGDEWPISRQLERDDEEFSVTVRTIKQQLDRAAGANLRGSIPVTITLYDTYHVPTEPPFRIRQARVQDSVDVVLNTSSVSFGLSASVGMQVSPGAFFSVGAQTRPARRC